MATQALITLNKVHLAYGHHPLLDGADLAIQSSERIGLIGRNGCLLYTSPSPRDGLLSRMPSSA